VRSAAEDWPARSCSQIRLLGAYERFFDLDAEISNRALQLAVTEEKLASAQTVSVPFPARLARVWDTKNQMALLAIASLGWLLL
jgi:hypothetical protein